MAIKNQNVVLTGLLFTWLSVSSFVIALLSIFLGSDVGSKLIMLKDFSLWLLLIICIFYFRNSLKEFLVLIPLILIIIYSVIKSPAPVFAKISSIRQVLTPYFLIFVGYFLINREIKLISLISIVRKVLYLVLFFGFFEKFVGLWNFINLTNYFTAKSVPVYPNGIPAMFIEPVFAQGDTIRMVSLLLDPINLGHTLVLLFCLEATFFSKSRYLIVKLIIIFIGLLLTFSKGSLLQLFIIYFLLNKKVPLLFRIISFIIIPIAVFILSKVHIGILAHFLTFKAMFDSVSLLGNGIAMAGNSAIMYSLDFVSNVNEDIGDSFWASIIGQIGVLGFLAWIIPFFTLKKETSEFSIFSRIFFAQILVAILSENTFNLLSIYGVCILYGAAHKIYLCQKSTLA